MDRWQDVRGKKKAAMNAAVSQLTADETKRPEKLSKHSKTADVKLDSLSLLFHYGFGIELTLCKCNIFGNKTLAS
ncbi:Hypothetical predicted protein [Scomber scombrus]|uniref:Uncharacterized protein n=1 Tax=Scomber scombrus TaxID=13677 RepID=A0AAV1P9G4_SCOSC